MDSKQIVLGLCLFLLSTSVAQAEAHEYQFDWFNSESYAEKSDRELFKNIKMRAGIPSPLKERDESERRGYVTKPICLW